MDTKQKNSFWTKRNIVIVVASLILLLGAIGAMIWWIVNNNRPQSNEPTSASQEAIAKAAAGSKQATTDGKLRGQAAQAIKDNKTADAVKLYQDAIDSETTIARKTQLYLDLSGVYYAQGRYADAFAAAEKANAINPDKYLYADWISRLYKDRKEYVLAAKYYRLAGQWATSPQNVYALDKAYYDVKAAEMDKLAQGGQ